MATEFNIRIAKKVKKIIENQGVTLTELAQQTGMDKSTISKYLSGNLTVPLSFLYEFKKVFSITLDDLVGDKTVESILSDIETLHSSKTTGERVLGNYLLYYYPTFDASISVNDTTEKNHILPVNAALHITKASPHNKVEAVFNILQDQNLTNFLKERNTLLRNLGQGSDQSQYYTGSLILTKETLQMPLVSKDGQDRVLLLFVNPNMKKKYRGGLGVSASVAQGRHRLPCIQKVIMSNRELDVTQPEFVAALRLIPYIETASKDYDSFITKLTESTLALTKMLLRPSTLDLPAEIDESIVVSALLGHLDRSLKNYVENKFIPISKATDIGDDFIYQLLR